MTTVLVLTMPNFSKPFIIEIDALGVGLGVVLLQEGRQITFISQALSPRNQLK